MAMKTWLASNFGRCDQRHVFNVGFCSLFARTGPNTKNKQLCFEKSNCSASIQLCEADDQKNNSNSHKMISVQFAVIHCWKIQPKNNGHEWGHQNQNNKAKWSTKSMDWNLHGCVYGQHNSTCLSYAQGPLCLEFLVVVAKWWHFFRCTYICWSHSTFVADGHVEDLPNIKFYETWSQHNTIDQGFFEEFAFI